MNETVVKIIWDPSSTEFGTVFYCVELNVHNIQTEKVILAIEDLLERMILFNNVLSNFSNVKYIFLQIHSGSHCPSSNRVAEPLKQINEFKPNTKINITVTPYTYWGRGDSTFQTLLIPGGGKIFLLYSIYDINIYI